MKQNIYAIYDTVAQCFNLPFFNVNNAVAIRNFSTSVQNEPHKNDYELFQLGEFDDQNGSICPLDSPTKILTGFDVETAVIQQP